MMTSDNKWGGNPGRSHNLGLMPWNEAGKVRILSFKQSTQTVVILIWYFLNEGPQSFALANGRCTILHLLSLAR
jgi:hypothetical protein